MRPVLKYDVILFAIKQMKENLEERGRKLKVSQTSCVFKLMQAMFEEALEGYVGLISYLLDSSPEDELLEEHRRMMCEEIEEIMLNLPSDIYAHHLLSLMSESPLVAPEDEDEV